MKHPNYSNRVNLEPKLDKLTLRPELRALMNSKLSALFFVGKLVWRTKRSAKIITKIIALRLVNSNHKNRQCTGRAPRVAHGALHDRALNRAQSSALNLLQNTINNILKLPFGLGWAK